MQNKNNAQKGAQKQSEKNVQNANVQVTNSAQIKIIGAKMKTGAGYIERMRIIGVFAVSPSKVINNALATASNFELYSKAVAAILDGKKITKKDILQRLLERQKKACHGKEPKKFSEYYVHQILQSCIKNCSDIAACRNYTVAEKAELQQVAMNNK